MGVLLDCAYLLGCVLASPWILYRLVLAPGRRDFAMRFGFGLPPRATIVIPEGASGASAASRHDAITKSPTVPLAQH